MRGQDPARDLVYVDVDTGVIVADYPQIQFAENRKVYSANNGTSLPGTLKRTRGSGGDRRRRRQRRLRRHRRRVRGVQELLEPRLVRQRRRGADVEPSTTIRTTATRTGTATSARWSTATVIRRRAAGRSRARSTSRLTSSRTRSPQNESGLNYSGESGGMNESILRHLRRVRRGVGRRRQDRHAGGERQHVARRRARHRRRPALDVRSGHATDSRRTSGRARSATSTCTTAPASATSRSVSLRRAARIRAASRRRRSPASAWIRRSASSTRRNVDILTSTSNYKSWRTATEQAATALGYDEAHADAVELRVGSGRRRRRRRRRAAPAVVARAAVRARARLGLGSARAVAAVARLSNGVAVSGLSGAMSSQTVLDARRARRSDAR